MSVSLSFPFVFTNFFIAILFYINREASATLATDSNLHASPQDFDSLEVFPNLNFMASWSRIHRHFWGSQEYDFESRYTSKYFRKLVKNPVKAQVYLVPYSHNDPGWKQTYEGYFYSLTKNILNNAMYKLSMYENMTFVWSEISFLSKWWDEASSSQKETLRKLVNERRFEILAGGWVMPDEGTTTLFGLVDQLIEGNQWLMEHLNILPVSAWSIDPFGHGSAMPYILKKAGITGMLIQRVHYGWKHWFAEHQTSDFLWAPRWSSNPNDAITCHNAHYDLYPTKHSCGPKATVCMKFDFRKVEDKREEHLRYMSHVDNETLPELANDLIEQYRRTCSLTRHNIVLTMLGGDFRWEKPIEWDQQFENYEKLFTHINSNPNSYHTKVQFGTLTNYFQALHSSNISLATFRGDFFPYSDVIFAFAPAYWTGYYSTRPYWKKLSREVEDELVKAEILFTFSYNLLMQHNYSTEALSQSYDNMVHARRLLALFQHHDGITGTSPRSTMLDYSRKLKQAWTFCKQIQRTGVQSIWENELGISIPPLIDEITRKPGQSLPQRTPLKLYENTSIVKKVVIFNSLGWKRSHLIRLIVKSPNVTVKGPQDEDIVSQINPVIRQSETGNGIQDDLYELIFVAELPPLSITTFQVRRKFDDSGLGAVTAKTTCRNCNYTSNPTLTNIFSIENNLIRAEFESEYGLLQHVKHKLGFTHTTVSLSFGRYESNYGSGAYLLYPFTSSVHSILGKQREIKMYLIEGPVISQVVLISNHIKLSTWIVHSGSTEIKSVIFMSSTVYGKTNTFGEYFMRFETRLNNTQKARTEKNKAKLETTFFFTDTNGLAVEKRVTHPKLPYQANHYPMTNFAFIQDKEKRQRFTVLVDRTHGVSSIGMGKLEMIFDRRLQYDDVRGMNEGVNDSEDVTSNYMLSLEALPSECNEGEGFATWETSLAVQRASKFLNHPPTVFLYDALSEHPNAEISLFTNEFPDDAFLLNLRTLSGTSTSIKSVPSSRALMILQRLGHRTDNDDTMTKDCSVVRKAMKPSQLNSTLHMNHSIRETNLVGTIEHNNRSFVLNDTQHLSLGEMYELHAYLVDL